jgi:hypothetical protein
VTLALLVFILSAPPGPVNYTEARAAHVADDKPFAVLLTSTTCGPCKWLKANHGAAIRNRWPHFAEVKIDQWPGLGAILQKHARTGLVPTVVVYERFDGKAADVKVYSGTTAITAIVTKESR